MNLIDKLLQADYNKIKEPKTAEYESERLKTLIGEGKIKIREVTPRAKCKSRGMLMTDDGKIIPEMQYDANLRLCMDGIIDPPVRDEKLQEHFHASDAMNLVEILFKNEVDEIADEIDKLGTSKTTKSEIKN